LKNRNSIVYIVMACLASFVLVAGIVLVSCTNVLDEDDLLPDASTEGFAVSVIIGEGVQYGAKSITFDNADVTAVTILVFNASGERVGSGALVKRTSSWGGTINVSENGSTVFEAVAFNSSNEVLYVGRITQTLIGANDIVTVPVGAGGAKGGSIQSYVPTLATTVNTFAGNPALAGTGTLLSPGLLINPYQMATDGRYLYVADMGSNNIRRVEIATQIVMTFAGDVEGAAGARNDGGFGTDTRFSSPRGVTTDGTYLYVADYANHAIRRITISSKLVEAYAGTLGATAGATEAAAGSAALFNGPSGITTDGINLYVADTTNNKIRKIVIGSSDGVRAVSTISGLTGAVGTVGWQDGSGAGALFSGPQGIVTDGTNLYIADTGNNRIRQVRISDGETSTLAGSGATGSIDAEIGINATFYGPSGITTDGTYLYIADSTNNKIRKVQIDSPHAVTTIAGTGVAGSTDGVGTAAAFYGPKGITTDGLNLFVSDYSGYSIRKVQ
jgi:sugar lactone lactonase YvrE